MYKKFVFIFIIFLTVNVAFSNENERTVEIIKKYSAIDPVNLLEIGDMFLDENVSDSAMICYSLIYNNPNLSNNKVYIGIICKALNKASTIYFYNCDYNSALELLFRALGLCEQINFKEYISRVYNNIGNVYYQFKNYKLADKYYGLAYQSCVEDQVLSTVLNNLGLLAYAEHDLDNALILYKKAHKIRVIESTSGGSLNNIGLIHEELKNYDSAFFYYKLALNEASRFKTEERESRILSDIGSLYLKTGNLDSALFYIERSNMIADKNRLLDVLSGNFLTMQKIEENRGNFKKSLEYYNKYFIINDSLFNISTYVKINELQFRHEIAKVDSKIKEMSVEQANKEQTIVMQRRFQIIICLILLVVLVFLVILYLRKKSLDKAYQVLFNKNMEIVKSEKLNRQMRLDYENADKEKDAIIGDLNKKLSQFLENYEYVNSNNKQKRSLLSNDFQNELISSIMDVMNDSNVFCDPDFSIDRLADMVNSNKTYVSQIINDTFGKNFRTFINEYRINEARRMFSEIEYKKYSIETISTKVGFKSKSQFNKIFKEVTGVTPSFYLKSLIKH